MLCTSQHDNTALSAAAFNGKCDLVRLLLDRGADMEAKNIVSRPGLSARGAWADKVWLVVPLRQRCRLAVALHDRATMRWVRERR